MTVVVGVIESGLPPTEINPQPTRIIFGSDTLGSSTEVRRNRLDRKIFKHDPFILGFTTSYRMGQILRFHLWDHLKELRPGVLGGDDVLRGLELLGMDPYVYMATYFVPAVRDALKEQGFLRVENNREEGGNFMVGFAGWMYTIYQDFQLEVQSEPISIGLGSDYALGSLYSTVGMEPAARVEVALRASAEYCTSIGPPFTIESLYTRRFESSC